MWAVFQVEPFASLSEAVRSSVPRLLMNRDMVGPLAWRPRSRDVVQLGDLVHSVERLVELLGWTEEMKDLVRRESGKVQTAEQGPREAALFTAPWSSHGWHQLPGLCRHPAPTQMKAVTLSMLTSGRAGMSPGSLRPCTSAVAFSPKWSGPHCSG